MIILVGAAAFFFGRSQGETDGRARGRAEAEQAALGSAWQDALTRSRGVGLRQVADLAQARQRGVVYYLPGEGDAETVVVAYRLPDGQLLVGRASAAQVQVTRAEP